MSQRLALLIFSTFFLLAGCQTTGPKTYLYQPPKEVEGQKCIVACKQSRAICKNTCNPGANACIQKAKVEYQKYKEEHDVMGVPVVKTLKQLIHEKACSPKECGCDSDFRSCYELCGGAVEPN